MQRPEQSTSQIRQTLTVVSIKWKAYPTRKVYFATVMPEATRFDIGQKIRDNYETEHLDMRTLRFENAVSFTGELCTEILDQR